MTVAQKTLQPLRRACETQSPVGDMYFQPEVSIHTYGALTYSTVAKDIFSSKSVKYELT